MVEFYRAEKVNETITAIHSLTGEIMYLIQGEREAALIDTCLGVGHLKEFVEMLTEKPLTVLLTHGHVDHAMGAPSFSKVYLNPEDQKIYDEMSDPEIRKGYIAASDPNLLSELGEEDFLAPYPMHFLELKDGDTFDLGGIHLDVFALPGHTRGTMIVRIREERILILGDACNTATFLFDENALSVEEYRENLVTIQQRLDGSYDRAFLCHHDMEASPDIVKQVIMVCEDIINGNTDNIPFVFMGQTHYIAKAVGDRMRRLDGGCGNVIYNKEKVKK